MARIQPDSVLDDVSYAAWSDLEDTLRGKQVAPLTIQNYGWALVQLYRHCGEKPLLELGRKDISGYLAALGEGTVRDGRDAPARPMARATIDTRFRALRRFYSYAADAGYISASPMRLIPAPQMDEKMIPVVSPEDQAALLRACAGTGLAERRDTAIIRLLLCPGGPRASELCGITLADVDIRARVVLIRKGKWARQRLIPMGPAARQAVNRYLAARASSRHAARDQLFTGKYGPVTPSGLLKILAARSGQAGIPVIHPHQLRHTAALAAKRARIDPATANALFGWSQKSEAMYARYGRAATGALAIEQGLALAESTEIAL